MPLTPLQRKVLRLLAASRSPDSYLAGGTVVNQLPETPRFSADLDIFHDVEEAVARCAEHDAAVLEANGFALEWTLQRPAFYRAVAAREGETVRLDWALDSAFRFFPVERDVETSLGPETMPAEVREAISAVQRCVNTLGGRR